MREKGKFSDSFNALNGNIEIKQQVLEKSNKLRDMGVTDINDITRVYESQDFLAFNDPLKIQNLELFRDGTVDTEQLIVAEVMDRRRGHSVFQFVNISENGNLKHGDILTIDPDKEGKENGTEFDPEFIEYCRGVLKEQLKDVKNIDVVIDEASDETILNIMGLKTYEDIVYMSAKGGGFEKQIDKMLNKAEVKTTAVKELVSSSNAKNADEIERQAEGQENGDDREGVTVEEAATITGISAEVLNNFVDKNGKILGIKTTGDVDTLSNQMGIELSGTGSEVVLLKVAGPTGKDQGFILNKDGSEVLSPDNADTTLVTELVRDGSNGDNIESIDDAIKANDVNSKKIEYTNAITGTIEVGFAEKGSEKEVSGYESDLQLVIAKVEEQLKMLENFSGPESERLNMKGEVLFAASQQIEDLQTAYGVVERTAVDDHIDRANDAFAASEEAKIKEGFLDAGKAVLGAFSGNRDLMDDEENERDPRENHGGPRFGLPH